MALSGWFPDVKGIETCCDDRPIGDNRGSGWFPDVKGIETLSNGLPPN